MLNIKQFWKYVIQLHFVVLTCSSPNLYSFAGAEEWKRTESITRYFSATVGQFCNTFFMRKNLKNRANVCSCFLKIKCHCLTILPRQNKEAAVDHNLFFIVGEKIFDLNAARECWILSKFEDTLCSSISIPWSLGLKSNKFWISRKRDRYQQNICFWLLSDIV